MTTSAEYRAAARSFERAAEALVVSVLPVTTAPPVRLSGRAGSTVAVTVDVTSVNLRRTVELLHQGAREARHRAAVIDALSEP